MTEWFANHILGMPELASKNGEAVDALIVYVHWLMIALFIGWVIYFGYAVWRFRASRHPKADYQGVRNHASSYLELTVAAIEAVLLIGIAIPVWAKAVDHFPDAKDSTVIYVMAQQYAWNIRYAGPDGVFGRQDMKFISSDNVFGVDPSDLIRQGRHPDAQRNPCAGRQTRHRLCQFQGCDPFLQNHGHAHLSGRDSRSADSVLVHAHERSANTRSIAPSFAGRVTPA